MGATNIQVAVRVRPFLPFEAGSKTCIDVLPGEEDPPPSSPSQQLSQGKSVKIGPHGHSNRDGHTFTFDKCFSGLATQVEIYGVLIVPLLKSCLEGYNATTVAYGQTGAGELLSIKIWCRYCRFALSLFVRRYNAMLMLTQFCLPLLIHFPSR